MRMVKLLSFLSAVPLMLTTSCGPGQTALAPDQKAAIVHIQHTSYNPVKKQLTISAVPAKADQTGEDYLDINSLQGVSNYATYAAPDESVRTVVIQGVGQPKVRSLPQTSDFTAPDLGTMAGQAPIPGVQMDGSIHPLADVYASLPAKESAVMKVAQSKMGTPYIWGHNEDRGQYGFDCSNFTAYVYHHALGYQMSGASKVQYERVGTPISLQNARIGDLIIFEKGKHCGIYAGGHRVLQEGGGLGKVGYISIGPGSYWGSRISVVKQMF